MNFKSEPIQGIYDFLEQDADVTNFKRDLIAVAEYKKVSLHDLEAEFFQYTELMKEDLSDKIVFIFREDGYLGMFGEGFWVKIENTAKEYNKLKTGDIVSIEFKPAEFPQKTLPNHIIGNIFIDTFIYIIHHYENVSGSQPNNASWRKYGNYSWAIAHIEARTSGDIISFHSRHKNLKILYNNIPNLIIDELKINELKETMHFCISILIYTYI